MDDGLDDLTATRGHSNISASAEYDELLRAISTNGLADTLRRARQIVDAGSAHPKGLAVLRAFLERHGKGSQ